MKSGGLRQNTTVNVGVYCSFRQNTAVLRHRFQCKRCSFFAVYDTASYGHNTVHTNRVIYGPYTVVMLSVTAVYVIVNGGMRSFTIVVMIDLGTRSVIVIHLKTIELHHNNQIIICIHNKIIVCYLSSSLLIESVFF